MVDGFHRTNIVALQVQPRKTELNANLKKGRGGLGGKTRDHNRDE